MKKDVSIILPSIRPQFLEAFYESACLACKKYTFEIIIPTPFDVPDEIKRAENIKVIKTHSSPTISKQIAIQLCNSKFLYNCTDDGILLENVIDKAVELHRSLSYKDVINMKYVEGVLSSNDLSQMVNEIKAWPDSFWYAYSQEDLRLPGIKEGWMISLHFFMYLDRFRELGGLDCRWEYSNHSIHDLMFRNQEDGGKIINLPDVAYVCSHQPNRTGDHGPVHDAQTGPDDEIFREMYNDVDVVKSRIKINYNNWENYPDIWERRFFKKPIPITREEYEEYKA